MICDRICSSIVKESVERSLTSHKGANDASRTRVQLSSTRTQKLESKLDSSSKACELEI